MPGLTTPCPTCQPAAPTAPVNPGRVPAPHQDAGSTTWQDCPTCDGSGSIPTDAGRELESYLETYYGLTPTRRGL